VIALPRLRQPRGRDPLGLRRGLADRLLPPMAACMALLAALALAGADAAARFAARWQGGAAAVLVQLPAGTAPDRVGPALAALRQVPGVAEARAVPAEALAALLRPWLGEAAPGLPLPVVIDLRLHGLPASPAALSARIAAAIPGAAVETHGLWVQRLVSLAGSLRAAAWAALGLVVALATAVVGLAVQAGIAARLDAITLLHDLGAPDGAIAQRFASRMAWRAGLGALAGTLLALPALAALADLAAPWAAEPAAMAAEAGRWARMVAALHGLPWGGLVLVPPAAAAIGWGTARLALRLWLRRLP
jgi:cell division transport system permease protein